MINGIKDLATIKILCDKCNKQFDIEAIGGYLCLCDECVSLCGSNYEHDLFMKSFDIFLGENKIANVEYKQQPVIHNSYFFKFRSIFEDMRLESDDAEEAVKESLAYVVKHVEDMKKREAERLKDIRTDVYDTKEYAKDCISIAWADAFNEGLYKGKIYKAIRFKEEVYLRSKERINSSSRPLSGDRQEYETRLNINELEALFQSKLQVSLFGYLFEVLYIDDKMKEVRILDHMRREKGPCLDERCPISFVHDPYDRISYRDLSAEEIEKIEKIVIERKILR